MFGDRYITDINGLWALYKQLGSAVEVLKENIGIYEDI